MYQSNKNILLTFALIGLVAFLAIEPIQPAPFNHPNGVVYYKPVRNEYVQSWRPPVYRTYNYRTSNYPQYGSASSAPQMYNFQARPVSWTSHPTWSANRWVAPVVMRSRFQPVVRPSLRYVPRLSTYTSGRHPVGTTLSPTTATSSVAATTPSTTTALPTRSSESVMPTTSGVLPTVSTPVPVVTTTTTEMPFTTMLTSAFTDPVPTGNINSSNLY